MRMKVMSVRKKAANLRYVMDYFAVEPKHYHAGDTVRVGGTLFRSGELFMKPLR